ncbi:hypothetical protein GW756_03330 [bacterium]|nr:hypothetical protein [bacterium]NCQ55450.1 hypothetical protein [Candidatus Parcubacteria bacterium]NCS67812.1 hypothetical protein [Candidatus Peregrinibacteria bacterium]NCS96374.1 hypothetical protein [bacterium]
MKRLLILPLLLALTACGTPQLGGQSATLQAYQADLRAAAIACGVPTTEELPVAYAIGRYDWFPRSAPFFVNGVRNQAAIAAAERCFWDRTKDEWIIDRL